MSEEFTLQPDETVIKRCDEVGVGKGGMISTKSDTLILTNQCLILIVKSMFHKVKDVQRYPLSDIVVSNGQPQVKVGKPDIVTHTLDVYFKTGEMQFRFEWEDEIKEWVAAITSIITGAPMSAPKDDMADFAGDITAVADSVSHAVGKLKRTFGIKSNEIVSGTCSGCGASLSGHEGETIQCPYCGTYHTF